MYIAFAGLSQFMSVCLPVSLFLFLSLKNVYRNNIKDGKEEA